MRAIATVAALCLLAATVVRADDPTGSLEGVVDLTPDNFDEIVGKVFRNLHRDDVDLTTCTYNDGSQMIAVTLGRKVYILNTAV